MEVLEKLHREDGPEEAELGAYWNSVLHRAVFNATGNSLMVQLYGSLWDMMQKWVRSMRAEGLHSPDPDYAEIILRQHRELVDSIRAADPTRARNAMKGHLLFSVETLAKQGKVRPLPGFFDPR
jgi:DNA-binding FadR family transcriptional regulator